MTQQLAQWACLGFLLYIEAVLLSSSITSLTQRDHHRACVSAGAFFLFAAFGLLMRAAGSFTVLW